MWKKLNFIHVIELSDLVDLWVIKIKKSPYSFAHVVRRDQGNTVVPKSYQREGQPRKTENEITNDQWKPNPNPNTNTKPNPKNKKN